jgi:hypothetical protein
VLVLVLELLLLLVVVVLALSLALPLLVRRRRRRCCAAVLARATRRQRHCSRHHHCQQRRELRGCRPRVLPRCGAAAPQAARGRCRPRRAPPFNPLLRAFPVLRATGRCLAAASRP